MANITWKDGVTTVATAGVLVLEWAHFRGWDIPLISDVRWAIAALAVLGVIGFVSGYLVDEEPGAGWNFLAVGLGVIGLVLAGLGLYTASSTYLVLLMIDMVVFWIASIGRHLTYSEDTGRLHA